MAVTPKGIVTPDASSPYNLITDLNTLASTTDAAIATQKGTASQRTAALAGAPDGTLWQDTDGIKMIWRKDGATWVPAVTSWAGTTTQMNAFTQAPNGFLWANSVGINVYMRISGAWKDIAGDTGWGDAVTMGVGTISAGWSNYASAPYVGLQARIKGGVMYLSGALQKSSTINANDVFFTAGANYRSTVPVVNYMYHSGHGFSVMNPNGQWLAALGGGVVAYIGASYPIGVAN